GWNEGVRTRLSRLELRSSAAPDARMAARRAATRASWLEDGGREDADHCPVGDDCPADSDGPGPRRAGSRRDRRAGLQGIYRQDEAPCRSRSEEHTSELQS